MTFAQAVPMADSWGMHGGDVGVGWMIVMVLFWGAVILGVVWLLKTTATGLSTHVPESPLETLDRRFAEGAISTEEYRERREVLAGNVGQPSPNDDLVLTGAPGGDER